MKTLEDSRAKELCKIGEGLFTKKDPWNTLAQEIADYFYPLRSDFTRTLALGDDFSTDLMDSYPVQARETLGNSINAVLRQGEWFSVKTGIEEIDEDPANARWLEAATKRYRKLVYDRRANFTAAVIEGDHDWVTFGNPVLSVGENSSREHLLFNAWHPRDCAWMLNESGKADHLQRKMMKSARNLKRMFKDKIHSDIQKACTQDPSKEFKVRHIVMPTDDLYGDDKKMRKKYAGKPYLSLYVDVEHETILGEGGLPVFTYIVPRYKTLCGIPQAFSPHTINSLPDGRMIQSMARIILEQGEKAVDPPVVAKGEMFRDAVNLYAGGMTYVDMEADDDIRKLMQTIETGNVAIGMDLKNDVRTLIAEAWLLNKLFLPDTREMTAFETNARLAEYRRAALPFYGPIESEYNLPLLDAGFTIAINNNAFNFADAPDGLKEYLNPQGNGGELTFSFESPLNTAEGRANVAAFQESVQIIAAAGEYDKSIPAGYDFKKMTKDAVKGTGAPADWELDEDQAKAAEQASAETSSLMQTAAALREGAAVGTDVANASVALREAGIV
ncbi:hypothetical protein CN216_00600 [Sinorhizobium meliloti]|nr:hypothetical protein CN216_00280 [Sinorhizobium meliloti]RVH21505.1 hypothetical protein CN216_00600 [Sinorhizobium meliloti]